MVSPIDEVLLDGWNPPLILSDPVLKKTGFVVPYQQGTHR
jgi:hypothetical protein